MHARVVAVIEWMSWLALFPVREIISHSRTMCNRYFPIGNVWCDEGMPQRFISRSGSMAALDAIVHQLSLLAEGTCWGQHACRRLREFELSDMFRDVGPHHMLLVRLGDVAATELDQDAVTDVIPRRIQ